MSLSARMLGLMLLGLTVYFALASGMAVADLNAQGQLMVVCYSLMCLGALTGLIHRGGAAALLLSGTWIYLAVQGFSAPHGLVVLFLIDGLLYLCACSCRFRRTEPEVLD